MLYHVTPLSKLAQITTNSLLTIPLLQSVSFVMTPRKEGPMDGGDDYPVSPPFLPNLVFPSSSLTDVNLRTAHVAVKACHCK